MKTWVRVVFSSQHLYQQSFKQTDKKATLMKCIFQVFVAIFLWVFLCMRFWRRPKVYSYIPSLDRNVT